MQKIYHSQTSTYQPMIRAETVCCYCWLLWRLSCKKGRAVIL